MTMKKKNRRSKDSSRRSWMPSQKGLERWPHKPKVIYLCGTAYLTELGPNGSSDPVDVFNSIASLKKYTNCWLQCGIVRVTLGAPKWVVKEDFSNEEVLSVSRRAAKKAGLKRSELPTIIKQVRKGRKVR